MGLELSPLMTIEVEVDPPIDAGVTPAGGLRLIPFRGGSFEGEGVRGQLLPGGTDWQQIRQDGVLEIRAHYLLETEQGERIEVISHGIRHAPPGVLERLMSGAPVARDEYYFRTSIRLCTAAERLAHYNRLIGVGVGERRQHGVRIEVFAVP